MTFILTTLILICSFMLLLSVNPIHSLLFLVLIFLLTTCIFLLLKIEFVSMLFLVVYLGAIIVLFLFVVMMLNIRILSLNEKIITYFPISFFIFFGVLLELIKMLQIDFVKTNNTLIKFSNHKINQLENQKN
jgi:NADH:ubiquinone oxidoreductase subunit 6 (subunit J)